MRNDSMPLEFCVSFRVFVYLLNKISLETSLWIVSYEVLDFSHFLGSKENIKKKLILLFQKE